MIDVASRDNEAVAQVRTFVSFDRWQMKRHRIGVVPEQTAGQLDVSGNLPADETFVIHQSTLRHRFRRA
jgi:hypothetical protein